MSSRQELAEQAAAYVQAGHAAIEALDQPATQHAYEQALLLYQQLGDETQQARMLYKIGLTASLRGHYPYAWAVAQRAYALAQKHNDTTAFSRLMVLMDNASYKHGDPSEWLLFLLECNVQQGQTAQANVLKRLYLACAKREEPLRSCIYDWRYLMLYEFGAESILQTEQFYRLGEMAARHDDYESARSSFAMALDLATRTGHRLGQITALTMWAALEDQYTHRAETCALYQLALITAQSEAAHHLYWYGKTEALEHECLRVVQEYQA